MPKKLKFKLNSKYLFLSSLILGSIIIAIFVTTRSCVFLSRQCQITISGQVDVDLPIKDFKINLFKNAYNGSNAIEYTDFQTLDDGRFVFTVKNISVGDTLFIEADRIAHGNSFLLGSLMESFQLSYLSPVSKTIHITPLTNLVLFYERSYVVFGKKDPVDPNNPNPSISIKEAEKLVKAYLEIPWWINIHQGNIPTKYFSNQKYLEKAEAYSIPTLNNILAQDIARHEDPNFDRPKILFR